MCWQIVALGFFYPPRDEIMTTFSKEFPTRTGHGFSASSPKSKSFVSDSTGVRQERFPVTTDRRLTVLRVRTAALGERKYFFSLSFFFFSPWERKFLMSPARTHARSQQQQSCDDVLEVSIDPSRRLLAPPPPVIKKKRGSLSLSLSVFPP